MICSAFSFRAHNVAVTKGFCRPISLLRDNLYSLIRFTHSASNSMRMIGFIRACYNSLITFVRLIIMSENILIKSILDCARYFPLRTYYPVKYTNPVFSHNHGCDNFLQSSYHAALQGASLRGGSAA